MKFLLVTLSLMTFAGLSYADTISCVATNGCYQYDVSIDGTHAEIYQSDRCSQMDPLPKFLVGSYDEVESTVDGDGNATYKSPDSHFTLLDQGRFGNTVSAIFNQNGSTETMNQLFCQ